MAVVAVAAAAATDNGCDSRGTRIASLAASSRLQVRRRRTKKMRRREGVKRGKGVGESGCGCR